MADEKNNADPEDHGEGEAKDDPEQKPTGESGDIVELTKQLSSMKAIIEKQQAVIEQFKNVGKESPPEKSDKERIAELETTLNLFKTTMEKEQQAKAEAERAKRELSVDLLIKEMPEFKDQRDALLKIDEDVINLFTKRKTSTTPDPIMRVGGSSSKDDWQKKLALAAERRKSRNQILQNIKY